MATFWETKIAKLHHINVFSKIGFAENTEIQSEPIFRGYSMTILNLQIDSHICLHVLYVQTKKSSVGRCTWRVSTMVTTCIPINGICVRSKTASRTASLTARLESGDESLLKCSKFPTTYQRCKLFAFNFFCGIIIIIVIIVIAPTISNAP